MPRIIRRLAAIPWLIAIVAAAPAFAAAHAHRVLLVSVDGLRPDLLLRSKTPTLHDLIARGSFTLWARTTAVSITLPSHTSMVTGCRPTRHGIDWNSDLPLTEPVYPKCPTLFEVAKGAGLTTAMVAGKGKFRTLAKPGTLDWSFVPSSAVITDATVADSAVAIIERHRPNVLFVHLPEVDTAGHAHGWGSSEQMAAIAAADHCIDRLLAALRKQGVLDSTFVFVSSDHGGAGLEHGPDDPRSRTIPWIVAGPGIRRGADLTLERGLDVNTEDTFATICWLLDLSTSGPVDGHPVIAVFDTTAHRGAPPSANTEQ